MNINILLIFNMMNKLQGLSFWFILAFLCLLPEMSFAQNIRSEGKVTDESGEAMVGVSISVKGTSIGSATDLRGDFLLTDVPSGSTLVFSYLGYKSQELKAVNGRMDVKMQPDSKQLDEVTIVAYGVQKKASVVGSITNINSNELLKSPAPSMGNAIAGKLPGVQTVQYSGLPGGDDPLIRIRGVSTFNGQDPLVMVDGVERTFSQIDPNEVADVTILRDASATAVFGVRGANGVIIITTKRGEVGKTSISVTTSAGIQSVTRFLKLTNSYEYATAYNGAQAGDGLTVLKFSDTAIQHFKNRDLLMLYPDTDWFNYMMKDNAWQTQQNINITGGSETAKFFVSVGMLNQDGLFKNFGTSPEANFKYNRYNYRANLDLNLSKQSTLSVNVGGRLEKRNFIGDDENTLFGYLQLSLPYAGNGIDSQGRRIIADPALVGTYQNSDLARVYKLGYQINYQNVLNLDLQYQLKLDALTKGLDFKIKGSYNSNYTQQKNRKNGFGSGISYKATASPDGALDENGNPVVVLVKQGDEWPIPYSESRWGGRDWYAEASLNYARKFGKHNVTGLALYNESKTYYPDDKGSSLDDIYVSIPRGYVGFVGRATYDYDTKYLADINMGYNGSENFAPGRRYGFFPSAALGWIPSSEAFWEPVHDIISYLKLRVSLGKVGNDKTGAARFIYLTDVYQWINGGPQPNGTGTANFGTNNNKWLQGVRELSSGNLDVSWETAVKQNYGFDLYLFKDKLSVNFDYFIEDRTGILVSNAVTLPVALGLKSTSINYGHVRNHGYELVLKWNGRSGDFKYTISPSLSFARNKIINQLEVPPLFPYLSSTGYPVNQPFGYEFFGFYVAGQTEKDYQAKYGVSMPTQGVTVKNGDCIYVDLNGDGKIDNNDQHAIGYTNVPEYTASVNMSLSYKGFDFSMLWIGATNANRNLGQFYNPQFGATNDASLLKWVYDNSWSENNTNAILPRLTFSNQAYNTYMSKVWLVDASFIRLKNVELGYTFNKIPGIPKIDGVRLYVNGNNLLTFSKFKANDPEARTGNYPEKIAYPMTRLVNFGLKVNF
jgi:TonB-linked SusC/RagA family outer membrane protein